MLLDELEDLFDDLGFDNPTSEQLYKMYGIFLDDFVKTPFTIKGKVLKINANKSTHPTFKGKSETFVHVVTRESKISGKRNFDRDRANKIHWVKPILENHTDPRIKYFERVNDRNLNQHFYWFKEKEFIVILREIDPEVLLITAFCVDKTEFTMYQDWYSKYKPL